MEQRTTTPGLTMATVVLALGGPPLLALIARPLPGDSATVAHALPFDLILWGMLALVLLVVIRVEQLPLSSIGLKSPGWPTLLWSLALVFVITFVLSPAITQWLDRIGLAGYERGLVQLFRYPASYRVFLAITAGVVEEALYRGYAVDRLSRLTGSSWMGGSIALFAFSLAHLPFWGIGPAVVSLAGGGIMTLFFVWKRDLAANMIAHAIGDIVGLLFVFPSTIRP